MTTRGNSNPTHVKLLRCNICNSDNLETICDLPLKLPNGLIYDKMLKCLSCGTYFRSSDFSKAEFQSYFEIASYNLWEHEEYYFKSRIGFFRYLLALANSFGNFSYPRSILDVGCSYGHMLEVFKEEGFDIFGVEIVDRIREKLIKKGYQVFKSISEIPEGVKFDLITFIDSLYYIENPVQALKLSRDHIKEKGIVMIRIANRAPFLDLCRRFRRSDLFKVFGDAKYNFNYRGIRILCDRGGYEIKKIILREKGKKVNGKGKQVFYRLSPIISYMVGIRLSPGMILICKPKRL